MSGDRQRDEHGNLPARYPPPQGTFLDTLSGQPHAPPLSQKPSIFLLPEKKRAFPPVQRSVLIPSRRLKNSFLEDEKNVEGGTRRLVAKACQRHCEPRATRLLLKSHHPEKELHKNAPLQRSRWIHMPTGTLRASTSLLKTILRAVLNRGLFSAPY